VHSKPQKLAAEFWGTFVVVLVSAGAVCANQFVRGSLPVGFSAPIGPPLTPSALGAIVLGPVGVAVAYGLAFACMSAAVGRISGGYFNPALTVGVWATGRFGTFEALSYCIAQLGGATLAAYLLRHTIPEPIWRAVALGTPGLVYGVTRASAMLTEGLGTFVVAFAVLATTGGARKPGGVLSGLAGGVALAASSFFAAPFTGGSLNPARAFGPAVVASHWTNHGVYWIGPLGGGVLAAWICNALFSPRDTSQARRVSAVN
jgi:MIP family channel proteins